MVTYAGQEEGLFTGYYEPTLAGSLSPDSRFKTPHPSQTKGPHYGGTRKISEKSGMAREYPEKYVVPGWNRFRAGRILNLDCYAIRGSNWFGTDDPIDAFFLHIQGSGRISLPDGRVLRLGYDGQNGHPYTSIGRELIREGALKPEAVSMQSIKGWLRAHPNQRAGSSATKCLLCLFSH